MPDMDPKGDRHGRLPMEVDLTKVADFFKVEPTTDAEYPGEIVFRLSRPSGCVLLGIDAAASTVRLDMFGPGGEPLLLAGFECDRVEIHDNDTWSRKLGRAVEFELADACLDCASITITQPPAFMVEMVYRHLNLPRSV